MFMTFRIRILVCAVVFTVAATAQRNQTQARRHFKVDDLFNIEDIGRYFGGPWAFSRDGQKLAFVRVRPKKTLANHKWEYLWENAGGDVWVQTQPSAPPVNITNGVEDGSGWWAPEWSPDGRMLAMLSTRGAKVRLWVWDTNTKQLHVLTERAVDFFDVEDRPYIWVDSRHLLCPVLPGNEQPTGMSIETDTPRIASAAWPKVPIGKEVTSSVLESGVPVDLSKRPQDDLVLVDAATTTDKIVVHGSTQVWQVSPGGDIVAFSRQVSVFTPLPDQPLPASITNPAAIELAALDGKSISINGELSRDVITSSIRWSPSGKELAFLGYASGRDEPPFLYRINLSNRTVQRRPLSGLDAETGNRRQPPQIEWTDSGALLLRAAKRNPGTSFDIFARRDWWLVPKDGQPSCLSASMKNPPAALWAESGRKTFFGLSDGKIWRLDSSVGNWTDLTPNFDHTVTRILWPARFLPPSNEIRPLGETYRQAIFTVEKSGSVSPFLVDLTSGQVTSIQKPAPEAEFLAYDPHTDTSIFHSAGHDGLHVWRGEARKTEWSVLVSANEFLKEIEEGKPQQIEYTSLEGKNLKGWLILPPDYQKGKRYPVLTWVYAGSVAGNQFSSYYGIGSNGSLNLQIAAARGYVVLMPSMPLPPEGKADDPMLRLPDGVLPAVDKVIQMGIGDPDRVFLMGQSYGGYSTYGLVTETQRFKAAASLAGLSDLISLYGQFDARFRYRDQPQEYMAQQVLAETSQTRMGNPPWKDLGRYMRNSPIFYVHRVQTPLLIIQGDVDYVALQQGEEFFSSLYRQAKRARFVRYWGEGHVLESPANVADMWRQIFAWFDDFGDIARGKTGELLWDGDKVKSRAGAPPLKVEDFAAFDR